MPTSPWIEKAARFQEALGRVGPQPLDVHSYTNKRFTLNFRAPVEELQRLLPDEIRAEEVPGTGMGMLGQCACDFWVPRIGPMRIPAVRNNDMLVRLSVTCRQGGKQLRGFYTLHSVSSSRLLATLGGRFSHFRKSRTRFERVDDEHTYALASRSSRPLLCGRIEARKASLTYVAPTGSLFADSDMARDFLFQLDGSCGYQWSSGRLSFQTIEYPEWDISFCHDVDWDLPLLEAVAREFELRLEYDSTVYMHDTPQVWGATRLFRADGSDRWRPVRLAQHAADVPRHAASVS
jgi:hypothetical protein